MEKIIVSINGGNGIGKTTFIHDLVAMNPCYDFIELNNSDKLSDYEWWFFNSQPEELINELYKNLLLRDKIIKASTKKIVLLDKGIQTIRARIYATLKSRNMSEVLINNYVDHFMKKCEALLKEDISILFTRSVQLYEAESLFYRYNLIQNNYYNDLTFDFRFDFMENYYDQNTISSIEKSIYCYWLDKIKKRTENRGYKLFGISGLSESGKSSLGKYIDATYSIWNLKIKYFKRLIEDQFNVDENNIYFNLFFSEKIIEFFDAHYYKSMMSLESFYDSSLVDTLKDIFVNNFKIIYIDANENQRMKRSVDAINVLKAKDQFKVSRNVDKIKYKCDILIDNNGSIKEFQKQIDKIFLDVFEYYSIPTISIKQLNIDKTFKDTLLSIEDDILSKYREQLQLFSVVGSCAFEAAIKNWSDIDILIIVKILSQDILEYISKISLGFDIHVGINCFDLDQVWTMDLDLKNKWYIYYIQNGILRPNYVNSDFTSPIVLKARLIENERFSVNEYKFAINRLLFDKSSSSTKTILKYIISLIKVELHKYDIICKTLEEVFANLKSIWNVNIEQYINIKELPELDRHQIEKLAKEILNYV
ncbi:MAG: hypothetical protein FWC41_04905 [Firmicutes bacterium]|nr:hypothetical protein [Bacillota bacterium]